MKNKFLSLYLYFLSSKEKKKYKERNKILWVIFEISRRLIGKMLNMYLKSYAYFNYYPKPLDGNKEILVSLTSFPERINYVWAAIDSMFCQKIQPSKIHLYLSKEEFPNELEDLPQRLLNYQKLGLEICFRDGNLMSHKKYYYALQEHADKCVLTIDDDIYYPENTISNLWELHTKHPDMVCANRVSVISIDEKGDFNEYLQWRSKTDDMEEYSFRYLAIGAGGVLYPPLNYGAKGMFVIEDIKKLSLRADDLWLKMHETMCRIKVSSGRYYCVGPTVEGTTAITLMSSNNGNGQNDVQWSNMCNHYHVSSKIFKD